VIPKVFHRIWLDEPVPEHLERFWQRFIDLHPGFEFVTWNDSTQLGWLRCKSVFDRARTWAGKSDVLRYEVMYEHGGIYVDTDVEPLRSFAELLEDPRPFAAWEDERLICPTVLGSPPGHDAFAAVLALLPTWSKRYPSTKPNYATGPFPFTHVWRNRTDVRLLPPVTFYPVHWSARERLGGPYPVESFCVHHWQAGWKLPSGIA